jgi:hypothetical protein
MSVLSKAALARQFSQSKGCMIRRDGDELVEYYPPSLSIMVKASQEFTDEVQDSVDRAGLRQIEAQYTPSSHARILSREFGRVKSQSGSEIQTSMRTDSGEFTKWLQQIVSLESNGPGLVKETALVLDTNVIMRHYIRNLLYPLLGDRILRKASQETEIVVGQGAPTLLLKVPRLSLLEIERQFNASKDDSKRGEKGKKRRLALYAARETLFLTTVGGEFLPELKEHTLEAFSRIAGEKFSDAWIRREVKEYWRMKTDGGVSYHPLLFATCDLMNALAASAEGLAVVYLSRERERNSYTYRDVGQVAELVTDLAVSFGRIQIGNVAYEGAWEGKTIWQWEADCVREVAP